MAVVITGSNTPTAGGVTYGDGTTYATTTAGTSGQVLTSAGASAPTWTTPSAGALTLISATTITGAPSSITLTTGISATYTKYKLIIEGLYDSASGGTAFVPRLSFYAGSIDSNAVYNTNGLYVNGGTGPTISNGGSATFIYPATTFGAGGGNSATAIFASLEFTTTLNIAGEYKIKGTGSTSTGSLVYGSYGFNYNGASGNNAAVTGIYLTTSTAVGLVGKISLYGVS